MLPLKMVLGYSATAAALVGYGFYIAHTHHRRIKPHPFSWLLWGIMTGIIFWAQMLHGAGAGAWVTGVSSLFSLTIGLLALHHNEDKFHVVDWLFLGAALFALFTWFFIEDVVLSVIVVTIADIFGYVPTLRKGWFKPHEDMATLFALNSMKYVFALTALESYDIVTSLYPAALTIMNGIVASMLIARRHPAFAPARVHLQHKRRALRSA